MSVWFDARIPLEPVRSVVLFLFRWLPPLRMLLPPLELQPTELSLPPTQNPEQQLKLPERMQPPTRRLLRRLLLNSGRMPSGSEDSRADLLVLFAALPRKSPTATDAPLTGKSPDHHLATVPGVLQWADTIHRHMFHPYQRNHHKRQQGHQQASNTLYHRLTNFLSSSRVLRTA